MFVYNVFHLNIDPVFKRFTDRVPALGCGAAGVDILQKKPKNAPTGKNSAPAKFPKLSNISIIK